MKRYESLVAWQRCHALVLHVYRLSSGWPDAERFGVTSQLRRAAVSAATNIAEGSAKRGPREFRRFLDVAVGSLSEVSNLLQLARDLGYVTAEVWAEADALRDAAGRVTWLLYRSVRA